MGWAKGFMRKQPRATRKVGESTGPNGKVAETIRFTIYELYGKITVWPEWSISANL